MRNKAGITFIKITAIHAITMIIVMVIIGMSIYLYCFEFIKQQRIQYNQQVLSQISYESERFYSKANAVLDSFISEDRYSVLQLNKIYEDDSTFQKIKRQVDFEQNVEECIYANGLGEFVEGVIIIEQNGAVYYKGKGGSSNLQDGNMFLQSDVGAKMSIIGPMTQIYLKQYSIEQEVIGFLKNEKRTAVLIVDMKNIISILGSSFLEERSFFITNKSESVIVFNDMDSYFDSSNFYSEQINVSALKKDRNILVTSLKLDLFEWNLNVVDSKSVIFRDIYQLWMKMSFIILIGTAVSMILFVLITRKVLFPIHLIKRFIHHVELDSDAYLEVTKGEIGEISHMINTMKKKIKELTEKQYILEMETTEARLQVLQSQMNPHFLYNTLDNIYCIAQLEEIEPITVLAKRLSEMLRYSINTEKMFVTLKSEIEYIKAYIEIINVRYENKISISIDIENEIMDCYVFRLLVQPLVENACLHGILPSKLSIGEIKIQAKRLQDDIEIIVENSGVVLSDWELKQINENINIVSYVEEPIKKGTGIALSNIRERIQLFYGKEYGLYYERIDGYGTRATIKQKYIVNEQDCYTTL